MENVRKRYPLADVDVLCGVDLQVEVGEFVSIVGRSGSGKTTLLNLMGGLDTSFEGRVEVDGEAIDALAESEIASFRNRRVGFVFQAYHLLDHLSCGENVALASLFARGGSRRDVSWVRSRIDEVLDAVGLGGAARRSPTKLSGGERQRVAVARALFHEPAILLCDEPTGNLDSKTGREIVDLLSGLHKHQNLVIVAATHDDAVSGAGDRMVRLREGRLVNGSEASG
ncbi:MAG: ABC transporter ATP-binding protein [Acidobacteriota bacterium]|nr:ABC transporter ATP-binding protein [Acidobacteriota bacterium]